jgi:hypothetical protein
LAPEASASATACSATTVFPEPVGAATSTEEPASRAAMARRWKSSSSKSYGSGPAVVVIA